MRGLAATIVLSAALSACEGAPCVDADLDGLGAGCAAGPDCDDANAARGADCAAVPPPDCDADPTATGCPCLPSSVEACGLGPEAPVGLCEAGRTRCVAGRWGLCAGVVGPTAERCDGQDQDCDGRVDETVRSPCGGCTPGCTGALWGDPFTAEEAGEGLAITGDGALTLPRREVVSDRVWVPNSADGTVSRIDGDTALETARYATGPDDDVPLEPSRVAVDWNGDAWIANRAFEGVSSVVRIAGDPSRCEDRDGDGSIATSNGPDDVRPWGTDECVLASVEIGGPREVARALAIDGDRGLDGASGGNAWVGLHDGHAFVEIDGLRGEVLRRVETPDFSPYAAAFDPWGVLWAIERDGALLRLDPSTDPPTVEAREVPLSCWLLYSLAIDEGGRLAMTGFSCDRVTFYDPRADRFASLPTAPSPRGATFHGASLWVAHTDGTLSRIGFEPLRVAAHVAFDVDGRVPIETIGLATDGRAHLWAISSGGGGEDRGLATRIDVRTAAPDAQAVVGRAPHVQGDPTGGERRGEFAPEGATRRVFIGCGEGVDTRWLRLHGEVLPGTHGQVVLAVRHAATAAGLDDAAWVDVTTRPGGALPANLSLPLGGAIEVRVTLSTTSRIGAPRVLELGVEWACPGPG